MQHKSLPKSLFALLIYGLILFVPAFSFAQNYQLADQHTKQADALRDQGQNLEAARMYDKAAAAEQASPEPRQENLAAAFYRAGHHYELVQQYHKGIERFRQALALAKKSGQKEFTAAVLTRIGDLHEALGQYDQAIGSYLPALEINKQLGRKKEIAAGLSRIGAAHHYRSQYDNAIHYYQQALEIDQELGEDVGIALNLNNIGGVYKDRGEFDTAIDYYRQALEKFRKLGIDSAIASLLNNIGGIYYSWGQYDKAADFFQQALERNRKHGHKEGIALDLNNIGMVHSARKQHDKAITFYQQALKIYTKLGKDAEIATVLNNIGDTHYSLGQYEQAIEPLQKALLINKRLGIESGVATLLNSIGVGFKESGQYDQAIDFLQQALEIMRKLGKNAEIATTLSNIGAAYDAKGLFDRAIEYYLQSIQLKEKIRKTATGDTRRDYLESQIETYQDLASTYQKKGDPKGVLNAIEQSRARLLAERISGIQSKQDLPTLEEVQKNLADDEAVLLFSNIKRNNFILLVITSNEIAVQEISKDAFLARSNKLYKKSLLMLLEQQRSRFIELIEAKDNNSFATRSKREKFETAIHYYRTLLTNPNHQKEAETFGNLLHQLLFEPASKFLVGKRNITIMPDGVLAFLPFEALVTPEGNYLAQEYSFRYTQSLTIDKLLQSRDYTNKKNRKNLLAMGGAIYDEVHYDIEMLKNTTQLSLLQKETSKAIREKRSTRSAYARLGMVSWSNLPGTLEEVKILSTIIEDGDTLIGERVTEDTIKRYSRAGKLAEYKVLHFATHGLAVPEMPELSAVVLSQFKKEQGGEDGYLRMGEIAKLKLAADFVNLSACETGLGRIYNGEGVVGLTQAFLIAGANGLSVSLWQIADDSTSKFMAEFYTKVQQNGMKYNQALTEVKRGFINGKYGEKWRSPFYWSPFIYYGS